MVPHTTAPEVSKSASHTADLLYYLSMLHVRGNTRI